MIYCKKCKMCMDVVNEDVDDGILIIDYECQKCSLYLIATWNLNKPSKEEWLTKKEFEKKYG